MGMGMGMCIVNVWRISLGFLQVIEKRIASVMRIALYGHVDVKFLEDTCVNAGLFGCGVP